MRTLWYTAAVVVLDQLSKFLVRHNLELHTSTPVVGNLLKLTYLENSGIIFGLGVGTALPLFTGLSLLALVLGGAIGNLVDRLVFGRVVDFIDVGIGAYRWYVFNVADSAVSIGVVLYLIISIFVLPPDRDLEVEGA